MGIFLANTAIGRAILNSASYAAVKTLLGLNNVDNTSDATKFASAALTGTPTAPTATGGTNTTQIATCAFVQTAVSGGSYQPLDSDLTALAGNSTNGLWARTGTGTGSARTITGPAAGITVSNGDGVSGNPTLALANDLAALEALSGTSTIYYRSGVDTWTAVTIGGNLGFSAGTLGSSLGTAATAATGTSGATVPLLNGTNTWSGLQSFSINLAAAGSMINLAGGTFTHSSGTGIAMNLAPVMSCTSTGGWTALQVNPSQSSDTGSGTKYLAVFAVGGSAKCTIDSTGVININAQTILQPDGLVKCAQFQGFASGYGAVASLTLDIPNKVIGMMSDYVMAWSGTAQNTSDGFYSHARSVGLAQAANGILEVNTGTAGTLAYLKAKSVIVTRATPASSSEAGNAGEIWADATYIYVQTASGTVKRVALSTF